MTDDLEMLRRYVEEGSEAAFAELVRRHVDFVYGAALRQSRNPHRAEDVTQVVFAALARKARALLARGELVGWLYVSTRFAATDLVRREARREAREREVQMSPSEDAAEAAANWENLDEVLDAVLHDLPEEDRLAVLLRFFKNEPYAAVGAALALSEDGARKRVERALDKMRPLLERRGITSTSSALAVALAHHGALAAPATLAGSAVAAAAAGLATASGAAATTVTAGILTMSATKIIIGSAAAIAVLTAGAVLYQPRPGVDIRPGDILAVAFGATPRAEVEMKEQEEKRKVRRAEIEKRNGVAKMLFEEKGTLLNQPEAYFQKLAQISDPSLRDHAFSNASRILVADFPYQFENSMAFALSISDAATRERTVRDLYSFWSKANPGQAHAYVERTEFPSELRAKLGKQ